MFYDCILCDYATGPVWPCCRVRGFIFGRWKTGTVTINVALSRCVCGNKTLSCLCVALAHMHQFRGHVVLIWSLTVSSEIFRPSPVCSEHTQRAVKPRRTLHTLIRSPLGLTFNQFAGRPCSHSTPTKVELFELTYQFRLPRSKQHHVFAPRDNLPVCDTSRHCWCHSEWRNPH